MRYLTPGAIRRSLIVDDGEFDVETSFAHPTFAGPGEQGVGRVACEPLRLRDGHQRRTVRMLDANRRLHFGRVAEETAQFLDAVRRMRSPFGRTSEWSVSEENIFSLFFILYYSSIEFNSRLMRSVFSSWQQKHCNRDRFSTVVVGRAVTRGD